MKTKRMAYRQAVGCFVILLTAFLIGFANNAFAAGSVTINLVKADGKIPTVFIVTKDTEGKEIKSPI